MSEIEENWYLIYTKPNQEERARSNLQNQEFSVFLPILSYDEKEGVYFEKMFPRYLFVLPSKQDINWSKINSTRGVSYIVTFNNQPATLSSDVIRSLKKSCNKDGIYKQINQLNDYKKGDKVQISKGTLSGYEGIFLLKKAKDRVSILMQLANREIITELSFDDLRNRPRV